MGLCACNPEKAFSASRWGRSDSLSAFKKSGENEVFKFMTVKVMLFGAGMRRAHISCSF